METRYALWDVPQPTCPQAAFTAASYNRSRRPREGPWRGISIEPSGKGSFQAVKLQRSARATVCSHSTRDMAATRSIEPMHDHKRYSERVSVQLWTERGAAYAAVSNDAGSSRLGILSLRIRHNA